MAPKPHILIVDDEEDILELLRYNLVKAGFRVSEAGDGVEALELAEAHPPDLVILDIMMPRMDGIECCRRLRGHPELCKLPIMMLTARSEEEDQVKGLEIGADVYLAKPISMPVLLSQAKAMLRRAESVDQAPEIIRIQGLEIDRPRYEVRASGIDHPIRLPRKEFELLWFLSSHPGRVYSRQDLLNEVWGPDVYVVDRTVDVHVRKIREKIGEHYVETVKGVGYRFRG